MWRSFFLALGICLCIWGLECLVIEKAVLAGEAKAVEQDLGNLFTQPVQPAAREFRPPEWAPWSLMSSGAVVILYSFTITLRVSS